MNGTDTNANPLLTIEKLVYGGQGLARQEGRVVLVPFVLPGEVAEVAIESQRRGVLEARLRGVVTPAAGRTEPACPFYQRCGGCQYQHAEYALELEQKHQILREVLRRVGKIEAPEEIAVISGEPWGYRNRTQFHLANGELGYFGFGTHHLVPVDRCPISSPRINETLGVLRDMAGERRFPRFVRSIEVFTNETDVQVNVTETGQPVSKRFFEWCAERITGYAADAIEYAVAGDLYRVRHRSFFQVNRFLAEGLARAALEGAEGEVALDLYAGVGLFSLPLARRFADLTAVESSGSAAGDLEFNAARAGVKLSVRRQPAEAYLDELDRTPDFVLADPPRAGLGKLVVQRLLRLKPPRLTVVACDPATLARDLALLLVGGYRLEGLTLVDLFPRTFHIETIARLRV
ncbi:MAG: class I SAM-dependent RNA methyltransferase [Bryobacteraceae bacterium]|jgi:23S rRNA (uracil1939-C5)-methyltransferase